MGLNNERHHRTLCKSPQSLEYYGPAQSPISAIILGRPVSSIAFYMGIYTPTSENLQIWKLLLGLAKFPQLLFFFITKCYLLMKSELVFARNLIAFPTFQGS